jgi:hypothetical protein
LAGVVKGPGQHVHPIHVNLGRRQIPVTQAVAQHRLVVIEFENYRDPGGVVQILKHDILPQTRRINGLGVLVQQQERPLGIEHVRAGLQLHRRRRPVGRGRPLVSALQIGDLPSEKIPVGAKLEDRAYPAVAERPDVLRGIENRLRPETEGRRDCHP